MKESSIERDTTRAYALYRDSALQIFFVSYVVISYFLWAFRYLKTQ